MVVLYTCVLLLLFRWIRGSEGLLYWLVDGVWLNSNASTMSTALMVSSECRKSLVIVVVAACPVGVQLQS